MKKLIFQAAFILVFLALKPFFTAYQIHIANMALINAIVAIALGLVVGYTGQISIGHVGFFAIGAYASAVFTGTLHLPFWAGFLLAGVLSGAFGFLLGFPALRLVGNYLALVTLAFGGMVQLILIQWDKVTHGPDGMIVLPPKLLGHTFGSAESVFYLIFGVFLVCLLFFRNIVDSHYGRAFKSIRSNELVAQSMGVNVYWLKLAVFAISAFWTGIAGALYGSFVLYISPDSFNIAESINFLTMVVIGGLGSVWGAVVGAVGLTFANDLLRGFNAWQEMAFGLLLLGSVILMPRGIVGVASDAYAWLKRGANEAPAGAADEATGGKDAGLVDPQD